MRSDIKKIFDQFIEEKFRPRPDLKRFFLNHPRKGICIDNLCEQIALCEKRIYSITFNSATYRDTIRQIAKMFCETALTQREQSLLSDAEKTRIRRHNEQDQRTDEVIEEMKKDGLIEDHDATVKELPDDGAEEEGQAKGLSN